MQMEFNCFLYLDKLYKAVADFILEQAKQYIAKNNRFTLVLSGGNTPKPLYQCLSQSPYKDTFPWEKTDIFWGDERCVPKNHNESNFRLAYKHLLLPLNLSETHYFPMPGEITPIHKAAKTYERTLRNFFKLSSQEKFPVFDLIILGMGIDGHTASLFPDDKTGDETKAWVVGVNNPSLPPIVPRLTLTLPVINNSKQVIFLVTGEKKHSIIQKIIHNPETAQKFYPAARIMPQKRLIWFVDNKALGKE